MVASRRFRRRVDHYYGITAFLAARGAQKIICRAIAGVILFLGAAPLVLMGSPIGPRSDPDRALAIVVAGCAVAMSLIWLRRRWPTRAESATCVLIGTICVAVAALIQSDPVAGLLGTTAFAVVGAFVALFHTVLLLAFTWSVAAVTLGVLAIRVAENDFALAVSGVALVAAVTLFAALACGLVIRLIGTDIFNNDIEPLTGLLNRDGFYQLTATLLAGRSRDDDRHLVIAVVNIDNFSLVISMGGVAAGNRTRVILAQTLRETVRHDALVAHVGDAEFLIADTFTTADPSPLVERVRSAITAAPDRLTTSIGVVSTPLGPLTRHPPYEVLDEIIALAAAAMYGARKTGGNRARYVRDPALTVLDDPDIEHWSGTAEPS